MDLDVLLRAIPLAAREETSQHDPRVEYSGVAGHCVLASELIRREFGGTIARGLMTNGVTHYWNILPSGAWVDSTRSQFNPQEYPVYVLPDCPRAVYWFKDTITKFEWFKARVSIEYFNLRSAAR